MENDGDLLLENETWKIKRDIFHVWGGNIMINGKNR
jgi:hypothetical protein